MTQCKQHEIRRRDGAQGPRKIQQVQEPGATAGEGFAHSGGNRRCREPESDTVDCRAEYGNGVQGRREPNETGGEQQQSSPGDSMKGEVFREAGGEDGAGEAADELRQEQRARLAVSQMPALCQQRKQWSKHGVCDTDEGKHEMGGDQEAFCHEV